jgi:DNA-binding response OmpR family regulator
VALILVVDDDEFIRDSLEMLLEQEGFQVAIAANGAEALSLILAEPPALMLLDVQMPVLDGPGLVQILQTRGQAVPTIVMTARPNAEEIAREMGGLAVIKKPFDIDRLLAGVQSAMADPFGS